MDLHTVLPRDARLADVLGGAVPLELSRCALIKHLKRVEKKKHTHTYARRHTQKNGEECTQIGLQADSLAGWLWSLLVVDVS